MARLFDDAQSEYLRINQVMSSVPFAVVAWYNIDDTDTGRTIVQICDLGVGDHRHQLYIGTGDKITAYSTDGANGVAESSIGVALATWQHAAGLFVGSTDRRVFLNGANKGTNATDVTPANLNRTSIGRAGDSSPSAYFSGLLAEVAIYDLSEWPGSTDTDRADNFEKILPSLAKGFSPLCYPLGLVAYWPLIRDLNNKVSDYAMVAFGPVVAPHPRVILPHSIQ